MTVGTHIVQWMIIFALGYFYYRLIKESDRLTYLIHLYELSVVFIGLVLAFIGFILLEIKSNAYNRFYVRCRRSKKI